jgi:hypothetical protein
MEHLQQSVNIRISVEKLCSLIDSGLLCVADLTAIDANSHELIRQAVLHVCMEKLHGSFESCAQCQQQNVCQHTQQRSTFSHPSESPTNFRKSHNLLLSDHETRENHVKIGYNL